MNRLSGILCLAALAACVLPADAQVQRFRANIRGGSEGKCTFEVRVDGVAEVEIHGDWGLLRTLQGSPATWVRLDCTQSLPNNPGDFRFKGIDGRGRQTLIRDPRYTGGVAVVRLEDPQGGSEGYTGDILWNGGDSHWGGGGNWSSGGSGWNDPWQGSNNYSGTDYKSAVAICRNQVSRVRSIAPNNVSVERNGGNGESPRGWELRFRANGNYGQNIEGNCTVSRSGQLLLFNVNGGSYNDRVSTGQAMEVCEREVERRLSVGRDDVRVQHGFDPGNGSFTINWQGRRNNGSVATGQCIVSPNGYITNFTKY